MKIEVKNVQILVLRPNFDPFFNLSVYLNYNLCLMC